jgi:catechol 2,3-dioxygenase-like lactoylglutathione lyase family enzyme
MSCTGGETGRVPPTDDAPLFDRLVPVLAVTDLPAERDFYVRLGFTVTYRNPGLPGLVTLAAGTVEFGLERRVTFSTEHAARSLVWQIRVHELDRARNRLKAAGVPFREQITSRDGQQCTVLQVITPNGYRLLLQQGP